MKVSWKDMRVLVCLAVLALLPTVAVAQDRPLCHDWTECRQFALKAYTEGDYEAFYDFARRSLAAGPPRDAKLMLLLARAESLTGRVDDAKRTLERLARMGVKVDIAGNDDFGNLRAAGPAGSTSAAGAASPSAALAATGDKSVDKPNGPLEVALRIPATRISPTGLAYDHVSGRFLMADSSSDKLVSVDELSRHMVDLVKADSAGFRDITAFENRHAPRRPLGRQRGQARRHRPRVRHGPPQVAADLGPSARKVSAGRRLRRHALRGRRGRDVRRRLRARCRGRPDLRLAPRTTTLRMACRLRLDHPVSLALAGDRAIAYVAHAAGLARVDLATGRSTRVAASKSLRLDGLERIRFDSGHIVGTQRGEDGIRHVVSIRIAGGAAPRALAVERLDSVDAVAGGTLTALSGDDVYFLTREAGHDGEDGEFVVQRARVR